MIYNLKKEDILNMMNGLCLTLVQTFDKKIQEYGNLIGGNQHDLGHWSWDMEKLNGLSENDLFEFYMFAKNLKDEDVEFPVGEKTEWREQTAEEIQEDFEGIFNLVLGEKK